MGLLAMGLLAGPMEASATIIVGGIEFADDAFATRIVSTNVPPGLTFPPGTPLDDAILGSDVNEFVDTSIGSFIELGVDQGVLLNRAGPDLAVFDVTSDSDPFSISLTVGGPTFSVPQDSFSFVGTTDLGFDLRVFLFDLSCWVSPIIRHWIRQLSQLLAVASSSPRLALSGKWLSPAHSPCYALASWDLALAVDDSPRTRRVNATGSSADSRLFVSAQFHPAVTVHPRRRMLAYKEGRASASGAVAASTTLGASPTSCPPSPTSRLGR
jgi:hypothetical protein